MCLVLVEMGYEWLFKGNDEDEKPNEDNLSYKIMMSLLESPKTFNQLLKSVIISRPTLTIKLDKLEKANFIIKKGTRKSPYEINHLYFNRSPLYPIILSAYLFNQLYFYWMEKLTKHASKDFLDEDGRLVAHPKPELLIEDIEKEMGSIILNLLILQTEKDIDLPVSARSQQAFKMINKFIRFVSIFADSNRWLREQVKRTRSFKEIEELSGKPYTDIEKKFMEMASLLMKGSELILAKPPDIPEENPDEWISLYSSMLMHDRFFYREIGFPFDIFYEKAKKYMEDEKIIDKILSSED